MTMGEDLVQDQRGAAPNCEAPLGIQWETVPCDLCGSTEAEKVLDGIDWEFGIGDPLSLMRCDECGLISLNPRPVPSSIPLIYPPSYSNFRSISGIRRLLRAAYYKITARYPYLDGVTPGAILDVGCATGCTNYPYGENGSLKQLKRKGWQVSGLELNESAAQIARGHGIQIYTGRLRDITQSGTRYDVIRFNHVLEHSVSPTDDLMIAADLLKNDGRLVVSGPNIDSAAFSLFGKYWSGLDLPRHYYHFSPATLRRFCEKAGFSIHEECHDGRPFDFIHSMRHFLQSTAVIGRNAVCQGAGDDAQDSIADIFSPVSRICLYLAVASMTAFFNGKGLSDSYTIVAARR
jgi:SAM-dependent methyltransferase